MILINRSGFRVKNPEVVSKPPIMPNFGVGAKISILEIFNIWMFIPLYFSGAVEIFAPP